MDKSSRKIYPLYVSIDLVLIGLSFYLSYIFRYRFLDKILNIENFPNVKGYVFIFILWAVFMVVMFKNRNLYATNRSLTIPKEISKVVVSIGYVSVLMGTVIFFTKANFFSRWVFFGSFLSLCIFLNTSRVIKRLVLRRLIVKGFHNINILIVGAGKVGRIILDESRKAFWWGFKVVGFLDDNVQGKVENAAVLGKIENFKDIAKRYFVDEVIITIPSAAQVITKLKKEAKELRLGVKEVPENFQDFLSSIDITHLGLIPLISYKERIHHPAEFFAKRAFDFIVSLIMLILLLPFLIIIAFWVKLDSQGAVFYIDRRVGFKGKTFGCYKFRSMVKNAEKLKEKLLDKNEVKDGIIFKIKDDPRVTRAGRFLRRFSLDELPQLLNVLKGDMNLVGPRPPKVCEIEEYKNEHMQRLAIRPGITGLSQIRGRSELTFRKWVKWDMWYINNWSFGLDLLILWWTIPAVLKGKGAY